MKVALDEVSTVSQSFSQALEQWAVLWLMTESLHLDLQKKREWESEREDLNVFNVSRRPSVKNRYGLFMRVHIIRSATQCFPDLRRPFYKQCLTCGHWRLWYVSTELKPPGPLVYLKEVSSNLIPMQTILHHHTLYICILLEYRLLYID